MLNRKEILKKREMLSKEIDILINQRESTNDDFKLNEKIKEKKKKYNFYNNLLKNM